MPSAKRRGLNLEEDMPLQRKLWMAERVGWLCGGVILVAAVLGLFGSGPLNRVTAGDEGSEFWLDYGRFARYEAPIDLHVNGRDVRGDAVEVFLSASYLDNVQIETVSPEPESVGVTEDGQVFTFSTRGADFTATFRVKPQQIGSLSGTVGIADGERVEFSQFVYP